MSTDMFPDHLMSRLPSTGPDAKPSIMVPARRAKTAALEPSGVTSEMYALIVAVNVDSPPKAPSITGPMSNARYPPGARYGNVATRMKQTSLQASSAQQVTAGSMTYFRHMPISVTAKIFVRPTRSDTWPQYPVVMADITPDVRVITKRDQLRSCRLKAYCTHA